MVINEMNELNKKRNTHVLPSLFPNFLAMR